MSHERQSWWLQLEIKEKRTLLIYNKIVFMWSTCELQVD